MKMIKVVFVDNWPAKAVSLLIAFSMWYLISSNLKTTETNFPVPGTVTPSKVNTNPQPLEDTILAPLTPPIPGSDGNE